ncbi:MAG: molybdopterin cofactor-binding domain-containing protein [bacterium]
MTGLTVAGGMMISFHVPAKARPFKPYASKGAELNAWLIIESDNTITIRVAQAEMGQGVFTSLPMIIADELEADWRTVRVEYADANRSLAEGRVYKRMLTGSSAAVRSSMPYLQQAGAQAREKMIKAAAEKWQVEPGECYADYGSIYHKPSRQKVTYGEIAGAAALVSVANVKIKTSESFSLIGVDTPRVDTPAKVNGSAVFGMDIRIEGMVYAAVVHCPVLGGTVRSFRYNAIRNMPGVLQAVRMKSGIAVVAKSFWQAKTAAEKLVVQWDIGPEGKTYSETFRREYSAALNEAGTIVEEEGEVVAEMEAADKRIESDYLVPYLAHACMEPLNCTVSVKPDRVDVWAGLQDPESALKAAAEESGVAAENVYVHNCFLGGGFGRRANDDFVREAVQIAREVDSPVQMIWSREDDIRQGQYRPMASMRFKAGFDLNRNVVAYTNHSVAHSILKDIGAPLENGIDKASLEGLANIPYALGPKKITHTIRNTHMSSWWWRSVGNSQNVFARECFVDEMAAKANMDPYAFRKKYLSHRPDLIAVLQEVADKSQWGRGVPGGHAQGIAIHQSFGTTVAQVAEVSVTDDGKVKVHRVVSVVDCGNLVNPLTAEMQIESAIIFGLSAALFGKITIEKGRVLEDNFDTYRVLSLSETPVIETHWLLSGGENWGGLGEPGLPCVAPAVINAIYGITRRRIRSLPVSDYFLQPA